MKILHITLGIPPLRSGGLINYAYSIAKMEKKLGHSIVILYPGHYDLINKKSRIKKTYDKDQFSIFELVNPSFVSIPLGVEDPDIFLKKGNRDDYYTFLCQVKPDIVHIHTFMGFHGELFELLKEYPAKIVYTTHDYYVICPKTSRIDENNNLCFQSCADKCAKCNYSSRNSMAMQYVLQSRWYPYIKKNPLLIGLKKRRKKFVMENTSLQNVVTDIEKVQKFDQLLKHFKSIFDCIDCVHCNSSITQMMFKDLLVNKESFVLNITSQGIIDNRLHVQELPYHRTKIINIGYIGIRDYHKGYWLLREAGKILYEKGYSFRISFYGDEFNIDSERYPFCIEKGMFPHDQLKDVMNSIDLMVIPAFGFETFGFATLEAIANGVPVLVSSHAGAKDLLESIKERHVFEPDVDCLEKMIELYLENPLRLEEEREKQKALTPIFSLKKHTRQLLDSLS